MKITILEGDLVAQRVDCIVNAWNRNLFPWWLLLPQGVSAAIKRAAGLEPFRELRRHGLLPLGGAVLTGPGRLPIKGIIHVAGIGLTWRSSERAIRMGVQNAMELARANRFQSIAFPLIGAGTGGVEPRVAEDVLLATLADLVFDGEVRILRYPARSRARARENASRS